MQPFSATSRGVVRPSPIQRIARTNAARRKRTAGGSEMADDIFGDVAQLGVQLGWIVAVDARDEVRALAKVGLVLFAPLDPFVILVTRLHLAPRRLRLALETLDRAWRRRQIAHST